MEQVRIIYKGGQGEVEAKKSRFIASVQPAHCAQEALDFIASVKKKYWDARHNCYAYIIGEGGLLERYSDDGEPQGTAGRPMLDVLKGDHICDAVVVVTRYFGGTLLGTGGLVRAYSSAVRAGLDASLVMTRKEGYVLTVETDYTDLGRVQHFLETDQIAVLDTAYTDKVMTKILVEKPLLKNVMKQVTELTGARAVFGSRQEVRFAQEGKNAVLL